MSPSLSWTGILLRFLGAVLLVFATFNPEGWSYYHWALRPLVRDLSSLDALKFLAGIVLLAGWVVYLQAARRSLGWQGGLLVVAICGGLIWLLIDAHLLSARSGRSIAHLVLVALAVVLTVGMSWSHLSRRLSGQTDTDVVA
jgi:Family of unknown function (DUF6524)